MAIPSDRLLNLGTLFGLSLAVCSGCSSPGPITSRFGVVGPLKASVAQLQSDNQTLRDKVATLKAENGRFEDELARQESVNGELTARLDDAKELIARQGGSTNALGRNSKTSLDDEIPPPVKTIKRSTRRSPPAASIPRPQVDEPTDDMLDQGPTPKRTSRSRSLDLDPGPQSRRDSDVEPSRWTPVVRGRKDTSRF